MNLKEVLKNFVGFQGRARRREYWLFFLTITVITIIFAFVSEKLIVIFSIAILVPSLSITVCRLHDIGKSGWWILIGLIPLVGNIILIVLASLDSQRNDNKYGPYPKLS
ncbi:DUF805 domain-containing protein [Gottfriedia solisilvae]|uniref:DUF805 domain-containing protein n=1 Tax=Gottfriedia solisilvae TaxID=1516104 RepID=UPI003D2EF87F